MLREYLPGLSLIEYTIIHSAPITRDVWGKKSACFISQSRGKAGAFFHI